MPSLVRTNLQVHDMNLHSPAAPRPFINPENQAAHAQRKAAALDARRKADAAWKKVQQRAALFESTPTHETKAALELAQAEHLEVTRHAEAAERFARLGEGDLIARAEDARWAREQIEALERSRPREMASLDDKRDIVQAIRLIARVYGRGLARVETQIAIDARQFELRRALGEVPRQERFEPAQEHWGSCFGVLLGVARASSDLLGAPSATGLLRRWFGGVFAGEPSSQAVADARALVTREAAGS